jgi:diamine N-acetyltransferase
MIHLEKITEATFRTVIDMKVTSEQSKFVAPNVVSLAQAWLYYDAARPFVLMNADIPVGFIMLDWDEGERTVGIWRFMIAEPYQKRGFGRAAMQEVIRMIRDEDKFDLIHLDYVPENTIAKSLYESFGFRETGEMEGNEIVMKYPLTDRPRVGMTTADEDDLRELLEILKTEEEFGTQIPEALTDKERITAAVKTSRMKRFTIMGEAIGMAADGVLLIHHEYVDYLDEMRAKI